ADARQCEIQGIQPRLTPALPLRVVAVWPFLPLSHSPRLPICLMVHSGSIWLDPAFAPFFLRLRGSVASSQMRNDPQLCPGMPAESAFRSLSSWLRAF